MDKRWIFLAVPVLLVAGGCSQAPKGEDAAENEQSAAEQAAQNTVPPQRALAPAGSRPAAGGGNAQQRPASKTPQGSALAPADPPPARAAAPQPVVVPEGTELTVRTIESLSTARTQPGETFTASLDQPLVIDGRTIAEKGATLNGRVVEADPGGRVKGRATLTIEMTSLRLANGQTVNIATGSHQVEAAADTKRDAAKVGIGSAVGAAIGAIAGGGKGAAVGAATGAGAGTGVVLATRGKAAEIPSETRLTFQLRQSLSVQP
ncbi:MAG: hypothetical protein IPM24_02810 [Bryobacterales bacterium]|nr:hypothetical protein [Bryobacterales bacterium]